METEREDFPAVDIEVIVADFTYANGEPVVRVVRREKDQKKADRS